MKLLLYGILTLFVSSLIPAQVTTVSGDLEFEIDGILSSQPGNTGDDFTLPTSSELNIWGNTIQALLDQQYTNAGNLASNINYDLIQFIDTVGIDHTYYVLKANSTNYWGTYVYNPGACRNLVIQAPHPKKDYNTGQQAIHVLRETNSLFYMVSGTSRCNHSSFSSCSGTTTICTGSSESFRISDQAHQVNTTFQSTTDTLLNRDDQTIFLQLHGFSKQTSDPFIIMSNGTRVTPANDYIATLKTNLEAEDALFVDSIKVAHFDLSWTKLIAFTNVQGRLINNSSNVCNSSASSSQGRFIHMEQEKTRLRDNVTGWNKVANAVNNTFACEYAGITTSEAEKVILYPNPTSDKLNILFTTEVNSIVQIFDITGKDITSAIRIRNTTSNSLELELAGLSSGIYFLKIANETYRFIKQ